MKYLMILIVGACLLIGTVPAMADQAEDEAAIREVVKQLYDAANKHDAKAFMALCDEKFENFSGTRKGRVANEEYWSPIFETRLKNAQYKQYEELGIHFITPDVAIYKARYEFSGAVDTDDEPLPASKWSSAWVVVKKDGKWLLSEVCQWAIEE